MAEQKPQKQQKREKRQRTFPDKGGSFVRQADGSVKPAAKPVEEKPAADAAPAEGARSAESKGK